MKLKILMWFILTLSSYIVGAQVITGCVYETTKNEKKPLVGANIRWLDSKIGTSTDTKGEFEINSVFSQTKLIVSYIGYKTDTIDTDGKTHLEIEMFAGELLNEVAVTDRQKSTSVDRMASMHVENISGAELHKAACCNLSQSFETNASVDAAYTDAATGVKQIRLLGLSGRYVQMMTENYPNFYGLATNYGLEYVPGPWMEAIQVSKGTAAVVNGYDAIAGQINVEYKKPKSSEPIYLNWFVNDKGRMEINFNTRWIMNEHWSGMISTHHGKSLLENDNNNDNFLDHPLIDRHLMFARIDYDNHKGYTTRFGVKYYYENRLGGQVGYNPDYQNTLNLLKYGILIKTNRAEAFWKNGYVLPNMKHSSIALINNFSYHNHQGLYGLNIYDAKQLSYYGNLIWQSVIVNHHHKYHSGVSVKFDKYDEFLNAEKFNRIEYVPGAFVQYSMNLENGLTAIAGFRADYHNEFGLFYTPRFHVKYMLKGMTVFRASAGKGWRTANVLAENSFLLASSRQMIIDDDILPEEAWNTGTSVTQYFMIGKNEWSVTGEYYHTWFENQLIVDLDTDVRKVQFSNLQGKSFSNTYQIELYAPVLKGLDLRTAFRYNDVKQTIQNKLLEVPLVSKSKGFITASYKTPLEKWQFDATAQMNGGGRIPSTAANPDLYQRSETFQAYPIYNAQITKYFKSWNVYFGIENLLDYKQKNPIIDAENPFGNYFDAAMIWGPLEGRKIYLGIRWQLLKLKKE
jgi:outer membrane receptor for ferrienterochelin and colicins